MRDSSAMFAAIAIVLTGITGAAFARWQRALSDWRKTAAAIPGMRRTTYSLGLRMVLFGAAVVATLYLYLKAR